MCARGLGPQGALRDWHSPDQPVTDEMGRAAAASQGHNCSPGSRRWHGPRQDGDLGGPAFLRKLSGSWSTLQGCPSSATRGERTIRIWPRIQTHPAFPREPGAGHRQRTGQI